MILLTGVTGTWSFYSQTSGETTGMNKPSSKRGDRAMNFNNQPKALIIGATSSIAFEESSKVL